MALMTRGVLAEGDIAACRARRVVTNVSYIDASDDDDALDTAEDGTRRGRSSRRACSETRVQKAVSERPSSNGVVIVPCQYRVSTA